MEDRNMEILENLEMIRELLVKTEKDITRRIELVQRARNERRCSFSRFSKALKSTQADLEELLSLIKRLQIIEGPECYHIIYKEGEIKSVEAYKQCTKDYEVTINNLGLRKNIVFSECRPLVEDLIESLPFILIDEE